MQCKNIQSQKGQGKSIRCPLHSTSAVASNATTDCSCTGENTFIDLGVCKCIAGYYRPRTSSGFKTDCSACLAGTFASGGGCLQCPRHTESVTGSTECYCTAGFAASGDADLSCVNCDGCSANVDFIMELDMTVEEMDTGKQADYVISVARWLSVGPAVVAIKSIAPHTKSTTRRQQIDSIERLTPSIDVKTTVVASKEKANSVALILTKHVQPLEYRNSTVFSASPAMVSDSIPTAETHMEYLDDENETDVDVTAPDTAQPSTPDDNSLLVYVIGGISIACAVCVVVSSLLVCTTPTNKIHPASHELYSNRENTATATYYKTYDDSWPGPLAA